SEEPQVPTSVSGQPVAVASREGAPRFSHIRAAAIVFGGLAAAGVLVGVLWSFLAPGVHGAIADTRDNGRVFVH
ncbi:DUF2567 domain-containing protein, partial [Mycobacteroides abscessus subsp. abscessus]|nr:DUF2567 domain-containing protein [Mycobacteroides abscessus subsp. abscessus]